MTPWYLRIFGRSAARSILLVAIALASVKQCCSQEMGWPREKTVNGARLVYYQPQVDEWNDFKLLNLRMAITITPAGGKTQPGVITAEMQTDVNVDAHTVLLSHPLDYGDLLSVTRRGIFGEAEPACGVFSAPDRGDNHVFGSAGRQRQ